MVVASVVVTVGEAVAVVTVSWRAGNASTSDGCDQGRALFQPGSQVEPQPSLVPATGILWDGMEWRGMGGWEWMEKKGWGGMDGWDGMG